MSYRIWNGRYPGELTVREVEGGGYASLTQAARELIKECIAIQTRLDASRAKAERILREEARKLRNRREGLTP